MQQNRHGCFTSWVILVVLTGAALAKHNGVHCLQVRGVGKQGQMHLFAEGCRAVESGSQMVLDIS